MKCKNLNRWLITLLGALCSLLPASGAGNPILLVGSSANPFSFYTSEILRAEGVSTFDTADITTVTAGSLASYDVVILGRAPLTAAQVTVFTNYVNGGGNLIAMRPDKQLASLFGIGDTGTSLADGYLLVNAAAPPGAGIVSSTIQFHGAADQYVLLGATAVATLYSSASGSTPYPAVTLRTGIGAGGKAVAFTYDLASSIVFTRQGNPAWAGQARVNQGGPIRAVDMFFGNAIFDPQPDWVDLTRIAIPQADEQQRLLVNVILQLNQNKKPLPRFWYFPFGKKAAVIMTSDDHDGGGTLGRFDGFISSSPVGCSLANWECVRSTAYIYASNPMSDSQASSYTAQGFEVSLHVSSNCVDYTPSSLEGFFASQLSVFAAAYPGAPVPTTNRTHCLPWSDWSTHAEVELNHGIRLDTNYYYWPTSWVATTPGFFTGSGMPMRFAKTDGSIIDVYQAATQMTDESGQSFPSTINGLLDNAVGSAGFYGAFMANMHSDSNTGNSQIWADQIVSSALSRGIPVVSSKQMLQWLDGRNGSSFSSLLWASNTLAFDITAVAAANGLQAMVPSAGPSGALSTITRSGAPVTYTLQTIKGVEYAFFTAVSGSYVATYSAPLPPVISGVAATPGTTSATITWTTDKASTSRVDYGTSAASLTLNTSDPTLLTSHSINITGLATGTTYYYRVTSTDSFGGTATSPVTSTSPASLTTIDPTPPVISAVTATSTLGGTATITWTTSKLSNSRVDYGTTAASLSLNAQNASMVTAHSVTLTGLVAGTTYYYRVTSVDSSANSATSPTPPAAPLTFSAATGITIWSPSAVPASISDPDTSSVELGMKFRSDVAGAVTGVRFYKAAANTGAHMGNLWSSTGTLLGSVTFANETASGWQQANFASPITIAANTTYVISYFAPNGHYSLNIPFFSPSGVDNAPLHALANGVDGPNGLFRYSAASAFPDSSFNSANYWVDVVFTDQIPLQISAVQAVSTSTTATITWTTNVTSSSRVDYGTSPTSLTLNAVDSALVTGHSLNLTGLTTGATYYYRVTSVSGSTTATFPVPPSDPNSFTSTTPPVISAVAAVPASTTAAITWTTDRASNSRVDYGTSPASLTLSTTVAALVTSHSVNLTGLTTGVTYYYRVTSVDSTGSGATSPASPASPLSFTTVDLTPPAISAVVAAPGLSGAATISWTTDEASNSRVDYGTSAGSLTLNAVNAANVTAHSITLTGLTAGATYYYRVTSADPSANSTTVPAAPAAPSSFVAVAAVTVWSPTTTPSVLDAGDPGAVELGMKFRSDVAGAITGVRFYKAVANTGTHTGHLWSSTGTLLSSVTFSNETASGWQQADFPAPIAIAANTTYVISYLAPSGHYSINSSFFTSAGVDNAPLHALAGGVDGPNGLYRYSAASVFPNSSFNSSNYWVDVVFTDSVQVVISAVQAVTAGTTATLTWTTNIASNSRVDYGTSAASLTLNATDSALVTSHSVNLTGLTTGTTYYYRVTSVSSSGSSTATSPASPAAPATFTPTAPPVITSVSAVPASTTAAITWTTDKTSTSRVDYGTSPAALTLSATDATLVTGHSVNLTGLAVGVTYYYRVTSVDGTGSTATSPASPASPLSFVTVDLTPPVISAVTAVAGTGGTATITWTTDELSNTRVDYGTTAASLTLNAVNATNVTAHSITLTGLTGGVTYYYRVTSADPSSNAATSPASPAAPASFLAVAAATVWPTTTTPATVDSNDATAVELGMKFRSDVAGAVTGVRFYKAAANTGAHTGHLWSSTGTLLGTATFTNETASGWQQANFPTPVTIAANTTYIISYFAPSGHYSLNNAFFASAGVNNVPLHALANGVDGPNGVYRYGAASAFPNSTFNSANYWVDVVFVDNAAPVISAVSAATTSTSATISWTTDEASTSRIDYGTSAASLTLNAVNNTLVTGHSLTLTGLTTGVTYYYRVTSVDGPGNSATSPDIASQPATVVPASVPVPVVSALTVTPGSTSAVVTWTTDLASNSRVNYGTSAAALTLNASDATMLTSHSLALNGLTASTTYFYQVVSTTTAGGSVTSPVSPASFATTVVNGGGNGNPPSEWDINGAGDPTIQGFPTDISVNKGDTISFKINTNATAYTIDIYRVGYYNGNGASKIASITPSATLPQTQPACVTTAATGLVDCGNWAVSASWPVPATAKSGVYFAKITRTNTQGASHIFFVVRDDASTSAILFQTSDTTWQAYNEYGGNSLYVGAPAGRAYKVSYNRPITTRSSAPEDFFFNAEFPMIRWLEANGYDVTYTTGVDTDRRGNLIGQHKLFISAGHDEYWSNTQRVNVEAARDAGVHLAFFSGNEVFWKTRWEDTYRTLVCYKETHANAKIDPQASWTGTWRDPRFSPPSDGNRPENALTGTIFNVNCCNAGMAIEVPAEDGKLRLWRGTTLQNQAAGAIATLTADTLGYEWDSDLDNGSRPAGLIRLSSTPTSVSGLLQDYGSTYAPGTATHSTTMYKAPSGALVFGAGTVQWTWGLDSVHDRGNAPADLRMQQAVVNLFADMGLQPTSLQAGLLPATKSTDVIAPTSAISSPASGANLLSGTPVVISGTASDVGGLVGGVEVSTDNGVTWHPATGRASWTYTWVPSVSGSVTIRVRATDDSLNMQTAVVSVSVTVAAATGSGGSTWSSAITPTNPAENDTAAVELGMKFRSDVVGQVTGVRFYKSSANTGTHLGRLWSSAGTQLASVTFTGESASGWQQMNFATPVTIAAGTTYVVSYYAPNGRYASDNNFFAATGIDAPPLHALANGADGPNGVYLYGTGGGFPNASFQSTNYWVDVIFSATGPVISSVAAAPLSVSTTITWNTSTASNSRVDYGTSPTTLNLSATNASMVTAHTLTLTGLTAGTTYYYRVTSVNAAAVSSTLPVSVNPASSFTTITSAPPVITGITVVPNLNGIATIRWTTNKLSTSRVDYGTTPSSLPLNAVDANLTTAHSLTLTGLTQGVVYYYRVTSADAALNSATSPLAANAAASFTEGAISLWGPAATPVDLSVTDTSSVEVGLKFRSSVAGSVVAVRFYKGKANGGTHTGSLWTSTGTRLGTVTFVNEGGSGWQQADFATPIAIAANTTYVISYFAPEGSYSQDTSYFTSAFTNGSLTALSDASTAGNGVLTLSGSSVFPTTASSASNYWVDLVFAP